MWCVLYLVQIQIIRDLPSTNICYGFLYVVIGEFVHQTVIDRYPVLRLSVCQLLAKNVIMQGVLRLHVCFRSYITQCNVIIVQFAGDFSTRMCRKR